MPCFLSVHTKMHSFLESEFITLSQVAHDCAQQWDGVFAAAARLPLSAAAARCAMALSAQRVRRDHARMQTTTGLSSASRGGDSGDAHHTDVSDAPRLSLALAELESESWAADGSASAHGRSNRDHDEALTQMRALVECVRTALQCAATEHVDALARLRALLVFHVDRERRLASSNWQAASVSAPSDASSNAPSSPLASSSTAASLLLEPNSSADRDTNELESAADGFRGGSVLLTVSRHAMQRALFAQWHARFAVAAQRSAHAAARLAASALRRTLAWWHRALIAARRASHLRRLARFISDRAVSALRTHPSSASWSSDQSSNPILPAVSVPPSSRIDHGPPIPVRASALVGRMFAAWRTLFWRRSGLTLTARLASVEARAESLERALQWRAGRRFECCRTSLVMPTLSADDIHSSASAVTSDANGALRRVWDEWRRVCADARTRRELEGARVSEAGVCLMFGCMIAIL